MHCLLTLLQEELGKLCIGLKSTATWEAIWTVKPPWRYLKVFMLERSARWTNYVSILLRLYVNNGSVHSEFSNIARKQYFLPEERPAATPRSSAGMLMSSTLQILSSKHCQ